MKAFDLKRVPPPPPPPEPKLCVACKAFRAECIVPVGEASAPMCWLCAHHVVEHEVAPHEAVDAPRCGCAPHEIYPGRPVPTVLAHGDVLRGEVDEMWRGLYASAGIVEGGQPPAKTRTIEEINAGIDRACREIKSSTLFVEPKPRGSRSHCGVCGEEGHYAKTCPRMRRGR